VLVPDFKAATCQPKPAQKSSPESKQLSDDDYRSVLLRITLTQVLVLHQLIITLQIFPCSYLRNYLFTEILREPWVLENIKPHEAESWLRKKVNPLSLSTPIQILLTGFVYILLSIGWENVLKHQDISS